MSFTDAQIKKLEAPLDPKHVKPPPRGKYGEYVDAHHVLTEANRIFGHDGWSYVITSLELCARVDAKDRDGNPQVRVAYRCTVRATVAGANREGAAVGTGMAKPENEGDAHESAVKEAETDALKRALRSFGNTFGLALYDKTKADVQAPASAPVERVSEEQQTYLITLCNQTGVSIGVFLKEGGCRDVRDVPASQFENAKAWIMARAKEKENA